MLVALGMVGIEAVGIDGHVDLVRGRIGFIKGKAAIKIFKAAVQPAVAKMLNAELDKRVLTSLSNLYSAALALRLVEKGSGAERQQGFPDHITFPFQRLRGCGNRASVSASCRDRQNGVSARPGVQGTTAPEPTPAINGPHRRHRPAHPRR